jgi:hypothetical protein
MSNAPYLKLLSPVLPVDRRDFPVAASLLNPVGANPLIDGEWLELNSTGQLVRGSGDGVKPAFALFAERGRYDTQAIVKAPVLFLGQYHASTAVFDASGLAAWDPLMVADVTIGALTRRGLKKATSAKMIVAYCSKITGSGATQRVEFIASGAFSLL